jgi:hypothetical protein
VAETVKYRQGRFDLIVDGVLRSYQRWEDLPLAFDHVVRFEPDIPPGPHSHDQHEEIALWNGRLQELMEIERARSNPDR